MPANARLVGLARVVHPFPSLLDAAVTAAVAAVAGAPAARVLLLALAMLVLQMAIGAANDWADAPADAVADPAKPIPAGLLSRPTAARLALAAGAVGLVLAAVAGLAALVLAGAGLAAGLAYDLRLKGSPWSWLPYAVGIPLLPLFAWVGATGRLPAPLLVLVPVAVGAGAALALANALADLERDTLAGTATVATALGPERTRRAGVVLQAIVVVAALGSAIALGGDPAGLTVVAGGAVVVAAGLAVGARGSTLELRRAWEVQAVGIGIIAAGWIGSLAAAGRLAG